MNYALQQRYVDKNITTNIAKNITSNTAKHLTGITVVVIVHMLILFALVTGLAQSPFSLKAPPDILVIPTEPVKMRPEPLRPVQMTPLRPMERITVPVPILEPIENPNSIIDTVTPDSSLMPTHRAGVIESTSTVGNPAGTGSKPADMTNLACPNSRQVKSNINYPAQARRDGLQGDVLVRFVVSAAGGVRDINVVNSTNRAFNTTAMNAVRQFECVSQGRDVMAEVAFSFRMPN